MEVFWLHTTFSNICLTFSLSSFQSQLDCLMFFCVLVMDLRRVWSRAFPALADKQVWTKCFEDYKKQREKKSWWGNLKGSGSQSLSLQLTPAQKVLPAAAGTCSVLYRKSAKPLKTKRSITCISTYGVLHELISANYLLKICKLKPCLLVNELLEEGK